jgi:hypothetical protein
MACVCLTERKEDRLSTEQPHDCGDSSLLSRLPFTSADKL